MSVQLQTKASPSTIKLQVARAVCRDSDAADLPLPPSQLPHRTVRASRGRTVAHDNAPSKRRAALCATRKTNSAAVSADAPPERRAASCARRKTNSAGVLRAGGTTDNAYDDETDVQGHGADKDGNADNGEVSSGSSSGDETDVSLSGADDTSVQQRRALYLDQRINKRNV